jgi:hypothetical protein
MEKERKPYARYYIVRGHQALWRGDPAENGSQFLQIVITSDEFTSTQGTFQLYALEGTSRGIQNGKFTISENDPHILIDEYFPGLDAAGKKFKEIVEQAEAKGYRPVSIMDEMEFQAKLQRMK